MVLAKLRSLMSVVRRVLFGSNSRNADVSLAPAPAPVMPALATAVAGYVRRATLAERFYLASRLASVARLNTPHGRIPRTTHRPRPTPPIPAERIGAKKRRMPDNSLRVLPMIEARRTTAKIIPFPASRTSSATGAAISKAA